MPSGYRGDRKKSWTPTQAGGSVGNRAPSRSHAFDGVGTVSYSASESRHRMSSISIIGLGGMARALAGRAVTSGHTVEVIGRDASEAADLAAALGGATTAGTFGATPAGAIVILAVTHSGGVPVVARYGDALDGKIVVDISNNFVGADDTVLDTPEGTSAAQEIAEALPAS